MSDISAGNSLSVPQLYSYSIVPFMFAQPLTVNIFPFGFNFTFIQRVWVFFYKNALYKFTVIIIIRKCALRMRIQVGVGNIAMKI